MEENKVAEKYEVRGLDIDERYEVVNLWNLPFCWFNSRNDAQEYADWLNSKEPK